MPSTWRPGGRRDRLHREPSGLSLQAFGDAGQCRERLRPVSLQSLIRLAQPPDLPAQLVDEGQALARIGHGAASASLLAPPVMPARQHHAKKSAEEEADREPPQPDHGIDGEAVRLEVGQSPSWLIRSKVSLTLGISCSVS
jgi:hypothetical protein